MGQLHTSLLCDHCSDRIVATSHLAVATMSYAPLVQKYIVVVKK
jgi:hypothetical protein